MITEPEWNFIFSSVANPFKIIAMHVDDKTHQNKGNTAE